MDSDGNSNFDYSSLPQRFPQLKGCRRFLPSIKLLSMLQRVVLTKKLPTLRRQAHWIRYMRWMRQDPCTQGRAMKALVVSYCSFCIDGMNITNKDDISVRPLSGDT
jgi:hypothetical protein